MTRHLRYKEHTGKLITDLMEVYAASGSPRKVEFKTLPTMDELISKTRLVPDIRKN
ncbi:MAG: hypothetical protein Q7R35_14915 [Elusimicrobiota bacterium]|nr:hypothetical protein [Elusimicrobiota bacterium]